MPDWPLIGDGQKFDTVAEVAASTEGTAVLSAGTTHTKGAWAELAASVPFAVHGVILRLRTWGDVRTMLDLGVGAEGVEKVIVPDLGFRAIEDLVIGCYLPISVPKGERLSARVQTAAAAPTTTRAVASLLAQSFLPSQPLSRCTAYGEDTSDSDGQTVDPGADAHTKGAWTELVSSTDHPIRALLLATHAGANNAGSGYRWLVDVGIGAADSEVVLIPDLWIASRNYLWAHISPFLGPFPCHIPAGTRIAVRAQCSHTVTPGRLFSVIAYGFD